MQVRLTITKLIIHVTVALTVLFPCGCRPASTSTNPKHPSTDPDIDMPNDQKLAVCTKASDRIEALHCKEARKDFPKFCVDMLNDNIPIRPSCLAEISACEDINTKCK